MKFHSISFTVKDPSLSALQTEFGNIHLFVYKHIMGPPNVVSQCARNQCYVKEVKSSLYTPSAHDQVGKNSSLSGQS